MVCWVAAGARTWSLVRLTRRGDGPGWLNPWNVFVRTCLFFGVEVVVSPPNELGWAQHVESFDGLWQSRTIRRHRYQKAAEVQAYFDRFCRYYNHDRPHPGLRVAPTGTRFPAQLLGTRRDSLRFPPGFSVSDYLDRRGRLHVPLVGGRVTFLRRVHAGGVIEVAGAPFFATATAEGVCLAATILNLPPSAHHPPRQRDHRPTQ